MWATSGIAFVSNAGSTKFTGRALSTTQRRASKCSCSHGHWILYIIPHADLDGGICAIGRCWNAYGWSKRIHWERIKEVLVLHVSISTQANTRDNIKRITFQNLQTGSLILRFNFGSGWLHLHVRASYYKSMMSCVPNLGESTIGE